MDYFNYQNDVLYAEEVPVTEIAAQFGTPVYIYSRATLERHWRVFDEALAGQSHMICYAVKANSNIAVLNVLARLGSGFDIVSGGELQRVLMAGGDPQKVVFSGVGKLNWEIERALDIGIACFNVESAPELERINDIALRMKKIAPISLRVNPDIDAKTHPYIATGLKENKFGVSIDEAKQLYQRAQGMPGLNVIGVDCHIGSQLTELQPFLDACDRVFSLVKELKSQGIAISHVDLGGGLGVRYVDEMPPSPGEYAKALVPHLADHKVTVVLEPGRAIAGNAGILVTQVEYLKDTQHKQFAVVDAAMNDLLRPALYQANQAIIPVTKRQQGSEKVYDVVGPVCETGDFLGRERKLNILAGDFLAVRTAGAYGFTMSSNYNSRPRVAEVMVDKDKVYEIRRRETMDELLAYESCLP